MHYIFLLWIYFLCCVGADPLLVAIANGKLKGRDNGGYYSYESIPYAEPPVGELRFEAPQPYRSQWTDTFQATQPPEHCLQWTIFIEGEDKLLGNEDCLTVSVYKPKNESRNSYPVVAYIHGGAFMFGGVVEAGHERIMASGNVILVKISYRLGPLGFLSTGDANLPGNFGLKDQRLALQWIQENIASFGGEPENILLMGQSAGAASVHLQLLHNDFNHLAKVAISISGNALNPWAVQQAAPLRAFELARILNCNSTSDSMELKSCLKSKDAKEIVSAVQHFLVIGYVPFTIFGPVVEPPDAIDPFLSQHPIDIIRSGKIAKIPWLCSYVPADGGFNAGMLLEQQADGTELIEQLNTRWNELAPDFFFYRQSMKSLEEMDAFSTELKKKYLEDRSFRFENYFDVQRMFTDVLFKNGVKQTIDLYREHTENPLYLYVYDNPADTGLAQWLAKRNDVDFGTVHSDDIMLIYNSAFRPELREDEQIVSKNLINMIENFAQSESKVPSYSTCEFQDNSNQKQFQILFITRDGCENLQLDELP